MLFNTFCVSYNRLTDFAVVVIIDCPISKKVIGFSKQNQKSCKNPLLLKEEPHCPPLNQEFRSFGFLSLSLSISLFFFPQGGGGGLGAGLGAGLGGWTGGWDCAEGWAGGWAGTAGGWAGGLKQKPTPKP
jgi:hypothetical protein